jgi:WD40 repeat protein
VFSSDGNRILSAAGSKGLLWNAATGELLREFNVSRPTGRARYRFYFGGAVATFSADNTRVLTATRSGMVSLRDVESGALVVELEPRGGRLYRAALSPDGKRIVTATDQNAWLWDVVSGQVIQSLLHDGAVNDVIFSTDGARILTASSDGVVREWDATNGEKVRELTGHNGAVHSAAYNADATRIVTTSADQTARIREGDKVLLEFKGHGDEVLSAEFDPDGKRVATASSDKTVRIWETAVGGARELPHGGDVKAATFSADSLRVATASFAETARIWDVATGKMLRELKHGAEVSEAVFSPDQRLMLTLSFPKGTMRLWNPDTGDSLNDAGDEDNIYGAAFIDAARIAIVYTKRAAIWDVRSNKVVRELNGHGGGFGSPTVSIDGKQIITTTSDTVRIWDADTGSLAREIKRPGGSINRAAFSPDRTRIVTANLNGTAWILDATSGKLLHEFKGTAGRFHTPLSAPTGRTL